MVCFHRENCEIFPMLGQGWQSQWRRIQIRLNGLRAVYSGREDGNFDASLDKVISFFEGVHHLKDWLQNDLSSGIDKEACEDLINDHKCLKICADLANGSKHLRLSNARTGDLTTAIIRNDVTVSVGTGTIAYRFYVQSDGTEYDALQVAESAFEVWTGFLCSRELL